MWEKVISIWCHRSDNVHLENDSVSPLQSSLFFVGPIADWLLVQKVRRNDWFLTPVL